MNSLETSYQLPIKFTYVYYISDLNSGRALQVEGLVHKDAVKDLCLNLQSNEKIPPDTTVHFQLQTRLADKTMVCNTYSDGAWGKSVVLHAKNFPFTKGSKFKIRIAIEEHTFEVYINDKYIYTYPKRITMEGMHFLRVDGDVEMHTMVYPYVQPKKYGKFCCMCFVV